MTMETLTYTKSLVIEECCVCHMTFAMPRDFMDQCRNSTRKFFYCPAGHEQHYTTNQLATLRRKLELAEQQRDWAENARKAARDQAQAAERSAAAYKGRVTRLKNRAAAGVCPCCNRTFENLHRHMASKHPDFAARPEPDGGETT
jgi:hypothetical protein